MNGSGFIILLIIFLSMMLPFPFFWLKTPPVKLIMYSIFFVFLFLIAILEILDSETKLHKHLGQFLLVFISIIGGTLFSTAWSELRSKSQKETQ